jgi:hypothetical protein
MKVIFTIVLSMDMGNSLIQMAGLTKDNSIWELKKEMEFIIG